MTTSLASAYGVAPPCSLTEEEKLSVLGGKPSLDELCRRLREGRYQKIIVMTGAGISVSSGIPDFRSPGTGLYATLDLEKYQVESPQELFSAAFFRRNPSPFFACMKEMFCMRTYQPTVTHHFIKLLATKGLLHRCYTQVSGQPSQLAGVSVVILLFHRILMVLRERQRFRKISW